MRNWQGKTYLGDDWALFAGIGGKAPLHAHMAFKIIVGLDANIDVWDAKGLLRQERVIAIPPNHLHQVDTKQSRVGLIFLDAGKFATSLSLLKESKSLIALGKRLYSGDEATIQFLRTSLQSESSVAYDARISQVVSLLSSPVDSNLKQIAAKLGLSSGRLSHLFSFAIGAAPARYRRWRKLRLALELMGKGQSIVDAALDAGFCDSAHLTRTCVEMLGVTPGLLQAGEIINLANNQK
jgi:AraC-like DNA-binding protein